MNICFHRGTNEIGATCLEIVSGSTRILIDVGLSLDNSKTDIPAVIDNVDAVFVSHCHQDHSGLLENIPKDVPVFLGPVAQEFINSSRLFNGKNLVCVDFQCIEPWKKIVVGNISVYPYLVDHSAPEAFSFLIDDGATRLFYSGDFRAHGRKSILFDNLCRNPPVDIDVLVLEGTMINRSNDLFPSEESVELAFADIIREEKNLVYLICSSQNIDRIVSAYRATRRAGRQFVIDIYTAWILEIMKRRSFSVPSADFNDVKVLSRGWPAKNYYCKLKKFPAIFQNFTKSIYKNDTSIDIDTIKMQPRKYLLKMSPYHIGRAMENMSFNSASVLYSQWDGYLTENHNPLGYKLLESYSRMENVRFEKVHTSGHAIVSDLKLFVDSISPSVVVPFHTEHKNDYEKICNNVKVLDDGEVLFC